MYYEHLVYMLYATALAYIPNNLYNLTYYPICIYRDIFVDRPSKTQLVQ